jgi:hypothetical protein
LLIAKQSSDTNRAKKITSRNATEALYEALGRLSNKQQEVQSHRPMFEMRNGLRTVIVDEVVTRATSIIRGIENQIKYIRDKMLPVATSGGRDILEDTIDDLEMSILPYEDAIRNHEEAAKSPDFSGLFFRFIGERGAERLDKAQEATTRIDNLKVARDMEKAGKDALDAASANEGIRFRSQDKRRTDSTPFVARYGEADETPQENLQHGIEAVQKIADGADEVTDAMHRNDLAQFNGNTGITFIWGKVGDAKHDYKKRHGISSHRR